MVTWDTRSFARRTFLAATAAGIGGLVARPLRVVAGGATPAAVQAHWALLSDTHIAADPEDTYRGFRPHDTLAAIIAEILEVRPAGAIVTGDLARLDGQPGDYAALTGFRERFGDLPVAMALGNHDNRENFLAAFTSVPGERQPVPGKVVQIINAPPVRFILLDSLYMVNHAAGFLGKRQRTWLARYLGATEPVPTLLCLHHTLDDGDSSLLDAPRLFDAVAPLRQVKAIIYGHSHVYAYDQIDGLHLINLPACGYTFSDQQPVGWVDARLGRTGGDFTLHAVGGNRAHDGQTTSLGWRG